VPTLWRSELPAALTQGSVDGQENGVTNILAASLAGDTRRPLLQPARLLTAEQQMMAEEGIVIATQV